MLWKYQLSISVGVTKYFSKLEQDIQSILKSHIIPFNPPNAKHIHSAKVGKRKEEEILRPKAMEDWAATSHATMRTKASDPLTTTNRSSQRAMMSKKTTGRCQRSKTVKDLSMCIKKPVSKVPIDDPTPNLGHKISSLKIWNIYSKMHF